MLVKSVEFDLSKQLEAMSLFRNAPAIFPLIYDGSNTLMRKQCVRKGVLEPFIFLFF